MSKTGELTSAGLQRCRNLTAQCCHMRHSPRPHCLTYCCSCQAHHTRSLPVSHPLRGTAWAACVFRPPPHSCCCGTVAQVSCICFLLSSFHPAFHSHPVDRPELLSVPPSHVVSLAENVANIVKLCYILHERISMYVSLTATSSGSSISILQRIISRLLFGRQQKIRSKNGMNSFGSTSSGSVQPASRNVIVNTMKKHKRLNLTL